MGVNATDHGIVYYLWLEECAKVHRADATMPQYKERHKTICATDVPGLIFSPPRCCATKGLSRYTSCKVFRNACIAYVIVYKTDLLFPARQWINTPSLRSIKKSKYDSRAPAHL